MTFGIRRIDVRSVGRYCGGGFWRSGRICSRGPSAGESFTLRNAGAKVVCIKRLAAMTLVITSLILSVGVTVIWALSYFHGDNFDVGRHAWEGPVGGLIRQDAWHLMWGRGGVSIWRTYLHYPASMAGREPGDPDDRWHLGHSSVQPNHYGGYFGLFWRGRDEGRIVAGFGYVARPKEIIGGAARYHAVILPLPFILLVLAGPCSAGCISGDAACCASEWGFVRNADMTCGGALANVLSAEQPFSSCRRLSGSDPAAHLAHGPLWLA
jgi:hypothetical protein